ncbi:MarR family winged helix-turn-helix transcriptional regulator [Reichenbachiella versicolor]|uniref:MarR family winged helix-turn-helix transcriptional regulator n=1 Tax=Reichenbachiella versicolor TaxID=1821036 RepID=UPI000D6E659C|nr:MarR family transcriptional regulator [Reichenbachiella versicolor]
MQNVIKNINEIEKSLLPWLGRTMKGLDFYITDAFKRNNINLTKAQFILLRRLAIKDGLAQHNLAFITDRDKASLTRLISTMERKELVHRKPSRSDKRVNHVFITEKGIDILRVGMPVIIEVISQFQQGISPEDIQTTIKVLEQIRNNVNTEQHWTTETT